MNLRPHHGICFQFYEGKGYSTDFTDHMGNVINEFKINPSQKIILKTNTDIVCSHCPNNECGTCKSREKVLRYDRAVLEICGLHAGDEISYADFIKTVKKRIIDAGIRSDICGDCCWNHICR